MENLTFRCSRTGSDVQFWLPDPEPTDHADSYEAVACPACGRLHLINKTTGRTLSDKMRSERES